MMTLMDGEIIEIYTDGGCRNNPGPGAWGFIVVRNGEELYHESRAEISTTNNRMELMALLKAAQWAVNIVPNSRVVFHSDSSYALNSILKWYPEYIRTDRWLEMKHVELIGIIVSLQRLYGANWQYVWVKGHADNIWNIAVDKLVNVAMDGLSVTKRPNVEAETSADFLIAKRAEVEKKLMNSVFTVVDVKSFQYLERYTIRRTDGLVFTADIYYNGKHQFTKTICNCPELKTILE